MPWKGKFVVFLSGPAGDDQWQPNWPGWPSRGAGDPLLVVTGDCVPIRRLVPAGYLHRGVPAPPASRPTLFDLINCFQRSLAFFGPHCSDVPTSYLLTRRNESMMIMKEKIKTNKRMCKMPSVSCTFQSFYVSRLGNAPKQPRITMKVF